ncbi:mobilization protein [Streptomyces sp. NPDC048506]|uniref:relaxase/mobilization nuclease domain-containing protein n=1 Tax=Streptomyces sp. NPDC048506 TaxID=3155028 RepID=UPI00343736F7
MAFRKAASLIADITRSNSTHELITYLFGPGLANEHIDPHLVASGNGSLPDPGRSEDFHGAKERLVAALNRRVVQCGGQAPGRIVWHCSVRTAPEDRTLTDQDWAAIARRIVRAAGSGPEGDDGCPWVAIRHADDHIHIVATTVRGGLRPAQHGNEHLAADEELTAIEHAYGLLPAVRGERAAVPHPTRIESDEREAAGPAVGRPAAPDDRDATDPPSTAPRPGLRTRNPWHQATAASDRIPWVLRHDDDTAARAHLAAFGEALAALPPLAPPDIGPQLQLAAIAFERVTRSGARSRFRAHPHARALRSAVRALRHQPVRGHGAALAMFLGSSVLVVNAALRWHQHRRNDQQVIAARRTLHHLRTAYDLAAAKPLTALALRGPETASPARYAQLVHEAVPEQAQQILYDPAWSALFAALAEAEAAGHPPARLLRFAVHHCNLDDAPSPAHLLTWRVHRLAQRPAPSVRALAAQARARPTGRTNAAGSP